MFYYMDVNRKVRKQLRSFINNQAMSINYARLECLAKVPIKFIGERVLEVGSGAGLLSDFFIRRGALLTITDGRPELVSIARQIYGANPLVEALFTLDLDHLEDLDNSSIDSPYDWIFAFGLIYHLSDPKSALEYLASICKKGILIETVITSESVSPTKVLERADFNQAVNFGYRASLNFYLEILRSLFPFIYLPEEPEHREYKGKNPERVVIIASHQELNYSLASSNVITVKDLRI